MLYKFISILFILMLSFSSIYIVSDHRVAAASDLSIGALAPDFELKSLSGEKIKLSDFRGKKVIVNFWATWCPPCKKEMPDLQKFSEETKNKVVILAVNIDPQFNVKGYVKQLNLQFPILLDQKDLVNTQYQIITIPTTFFIDEQGIIRHKHHSIMNIETIRDYINRM